MEEIWKDIPITNNNYSASNFGNIKRNIGYVKNNINGGVRKVGGKTLSPKTKSNGYLEVSIGFGSLGGRSMYVHRLVIDAFHGEIPDGYAVNHKDFNKSNNHIDNLEIVTYSENSQHFYDNGNYKPNPVRGEKNHLASFTDKEVINIRKMYSEGMYPMEISKKLNRSKSTIDKICRRQTWKHL